MSKKISIIIIFLAFLSQIKATELKDSIADKTLVYKFDIKTEIVPSVWRQTKQSIEEAHKINADYILIHMNTYGGLVNVADSIRTKILNSDIPVYVFIDNNAASAGALISIACDRIYMRKGGSIGAATVVNQTGEVVPDKYQSFMRSTMRATAQAHGKDTIIQENDTIIKWKRDPKIAEAMVDPSIYIENIIDTGKVLTFTTEEAILNGYCEGQAENVAEVLETADIKNYEIKEYKITALEKIIGFLIHPAVHGILIMIIIGGIYFELQSPGIGFPIAATAIAAILYFAPLYLEGLAENWEMILFFVGVILVLLEIFVIPGFGIAGISGILLIILGLTLSMIDNIVFNFEGDGKGAIVLTKALFVVIGSMFLSLVASIYLSKKILTAPAFSALVLNATQKNEEGFVAVENATHKIIGKEGTAYTVLRPSGKVEVDGEIYDAKSEIGFIDKGVKVSIIKYEAGQIYVIKA